MSYEVGDEVVAVVDEFIVYHKTADAIVEKESLSRLSCVSKMLFFITLFCGVVLMLVGNFSSISNVVLQPEFRVYYFLFLLFSLVSTVVLIGVQYKLTGNFLKNTELQILNDSRDTIKREAIFFDGLSKYSLTALEHVQYRFNAMSEKGNSMIGLFVGFIGKTGIIPAVVLIIVAILNVGEKAGFSVIGHIAFFAVIMYFLMFRMMLVVIQCKSYSEILNFYIENYRKEK